MQVNTHIWFHQSISQITQITTVKFYENRLVHLISTFANTQTVDSVEQYYKNKKVSIQQPNIVKIYNQNLGGADLADSLIELYRIQIKSKKHYH